RGISRLDVLREDEDADLWIQPADLLGRYQALVGLRWWHADVRDRDGRPQFRNFLQELVGIRGRADDREARVAEKPHEAFAQGDGIGGGGRPLRGGRGGRAGG